MKNGKCGDKLFWTLEDETLTISGEGPLRVLSWTKDYGLYDDFNDEWSYTYYPTSPWFEDEPKNHPIIRKVIIKEGVTRIEEQVFCGLGGYNCHDYLKSVEIADSVTDIGDSAFYGCRALKEVRLPAALRSIGRKTFGECASLEKISMPDWVEVAVDAFDGTALLNTPERADGFVILGCSAYKYNGPKTARIRIPDGVKSIGNACFKSDNSEYNDWLEAVEIPEGVKVIEAGAFENCRRLKSVTFPEGLERIEGDSFSGCTDLESVTLPDSLKVIKREAFRDCENLKSVTIPEGVTEIGVETFAHCINLERVTLPNSLKVIGTNAFAHCINLESITIPEGVTKIGYDAFAHCINLERVTLPNSLKVIAGFKGCKGLKCIAIPEGVTKIGYDAFAHCINLESITIPEGVTEIGVGTFSHCINLESITIPEGVIEIEDVSFLRCTKLKSVTLPDSLKVIGDEVFIDCKGLKSITIPEGVTEIGAWAFADCINLESIIIPESVIEIGAWAFNACKELESITIPDRLKVIEDEAFRGCKNLKSITIPEGVTKIGVGTFAYCTDLKSVTFPKSLKEIGAAAFAYCRLRSITIPDSVDKIDIIAFADCHYLSEVSFLSDATVFPCSAFSETSWLKNQRENRTKNIIAGGSLHIYADNKDSYTIPSNVKCIESYAIERNKIKELVIPQSVETIKADACCHCENLEVLRLPENLNMFDSGLQYNNTEWDKKFPLYSYSLPRDLQHEICTFFRDCPAVKYIFHGSKCIEVNGIEALGSAGENVIWIKHFDNTVTFLGKGKIDFSYLKKEYQYEEEVIDRHELQDCVEVSYVWDRTNSDTYSKSPIMYDIIMCDGVEPTLFPRSLDVYSDMELSEYVSKSPTYEYRVRREEQNTGENK